MKYILFGMIFSFFVLQGMDEARISKAPVWHSNSQESEKETSCGICRNTQNEKQMRALRCHPQHIFHEECIDEWKTRANHCPICRTSINLNCFEKCRIVTKNCLDDSICPFCVSMAAIILPLSRYALSCAKARYSSSPDQCTNISSTIAGMALGFSSGCLGLCVGYQLYNCCEDWKKLK